MPFIRESIGGMMVRRELQLSPSVSQNMFPEYGRRETEFQARPRTAMLPTRGHSRFDSFGERVVGMTGTRELEERMAVVSGRTLRLYRDPGDAASLTTLHVEGRPDATEVVAYPNLGCYAHADNEFYYACTDGRIRRRSPAGSVDVALAPPDWTPLGLAGERATGRVWVTAVDGPRIRCYTRQGSGNLDRTPSLDLDPLAAGSVVQQPEAVSFHDGVLALLDAYAGEVYLFELAGTEWTYISQGGLQNTLSLQFAAGSSETRRPVEPAGIRLTSTTVQVADRGTRRVYEFSRGTGGVRTSYAIHANVAAGAGGFVSGRTNAEVFVDGKTADPVTGADVQTGLTSPTPGPEVFRPSNILPLDDSARWLAWTCDRKVHLVDLRNDRVVMNAAAAVDQLTATSGRFIGVDRAEGWLKVSPPGGQFPLVGSEDTQLKVAENGAGIDVPGWPRSDSRPLRSVYVGARYLLVNQDDFSLLRYERGKTPGDSLIEKPPVQVLSNNVAFVCASGGTRTAGQCVLVLRGSNDARVHVRWFDRTPSTAAETNPGGATQVFTNLNLSVGGNISWSEIRSVACDDDYIYFLFSDNGTPRSTVFRRRDGQPVAALSTLHNINTWGPPSNAGYTNAGVWGLDMAGGILRASLRSTENDRPTIIRALRRNGESGYSALPEHAIDAGLFTQSTTLTHDSKFLYDVAGGEQTDRVLADGTQTRSVSLVAFWLADPYRRSAFRWRPDLWQQARAVSVSAIRGRVYAFSGTSLRLWESDPGIAEGFPFNPVGVRDVGITAPDSLAVVEEVLFWVGASPGGGVRCWRIGADSDTAPDPNLSQSIEEIIDGIGADIVTARGWTDDNGGHPTFVVGWRKPGITLAYDSNSVEWHTRTSLRLAGDTGDPFPWQDAEQGHYRVEVSAQWRNRQFMGGYGSAGGLVVEPSVTDWRDVDGGVVQRVRAFHGLRSERRLVRSAPVRVDTTYEQGNRAGTTVGVVSPHFTLQTSGDGGRTWGDPRRRNMGTDLPATFYGIGTSRFRAYRIVCESPVGFMILGVYTGEPKVGRRT